MFDDFSHMDQLAGAAPGFFCLNLEHREGDHISWVSMMAYQEHVNDLWCFMVCQVFVMSFCDGLITFDHRKSSTCQLAWTHLATQEIHMETNQWIRQILRPRKQHNSRKIYTMATSHCWHLFQGARRSKHPNEGSHIDEWSGWINVTRKFHCPHDKRIKTKTMSKPYIMVPNMHLKPV